MPTMAELASEGRSGPKVAGGPVEACTANEGPAGPANGSAWAKWPEPASSKRDRRARWARYGSDGPGEMGTCPVRACGMWPMCPGVT